MDVVFGIAVMIVLGVVAQAVVACGGGGSSPASCEPASSQVVDDIRVILDAYPEIGATLADGAQQSVVDVPLGGARSEFRTLVADSGGNVKGSPPKMSDTRRAATRSPTLESLPLS